MFCACFWQICPCGKLRDAAGICRIAWQPCLDSRFQQLCSCLDFGRLRLWAITQDCILVLNVFPCDRQTSWKFFLHEITRSGLIWWRWQCHSSVVSRTCFKKSLLHAFMTLHEVNIPWLIGTEVLILPHNDKNNSIESLWGNMKEVCVDFWSRCPHSKRLRRSYGLCLRHRCSATGMCSLVSFEKKKETKRQYLLFSDVTTLLGMGKQTGNCWGEKDCRIQNSKVLPFAYNGRGIRAWPACALSAHSKLCPCAEEERNIITLAARGKLVLLKARTDWRNLKPKLYRGGILFSVWAEQQQ